MASSSAFRIGIAGLGTVGAGVIRILHDHADLIAARAGRRIEVVAVSARDRKKERGVDLSGIVWADQAENLSTYEGLDAVVELVGGADGVAYGLVHDALLGGRAVVTANKALLAHHGHGLALLSESKGAPLLYEAAVAGGIPIIKTLREGFAANEIRAVYGILNGTCNYILTTMRETGRDFSDVLAEAQEKGYAEADPSFDVDGVDAAHKLCILSALSFGIKPDLDALKIEGIRAITASDIAYAQELGYRIKLLGIARNIDGKIAQMVEPCLVPEGSPIGAVEGVFNAVYVDGDFVDTGLAVGRGAGAGPTASAVVADLIDLARGQGKAPVFGIPATSMKEAMVADTGDLASRFYLRLVVLDKPGVLADIAAVMRDHNVSMEAVIQRGRDPDKPVSIVITSHRVRQADIHAAITRIAAMPFMTDKPCLLRIEKF